MSPPTSALTPLHAPTSPSPASAHTPYEWACAPRLPSITTLRSQPAHAHTHTWHTTAHARTRREGAPARQRVGPSLRPDRHGMRRCRSLSWCRVNIADVCDAFGRGVRGEMSGTLDRMLASGPALRDGSRSRRSSARVAVCKTHQLGHVEARGQTMAPSTCFSSPSISKSSRRSRALSRS